MTAPSCPSCATPLPSEAAFCPRCGAATPTSLSGADVSREDQPGTAADDPEFRARLQLALGPDYQLGTAIGQGGFGRVYRATDVRLDRQVAIKVIRPELAGARVFLTRFRREGIALAKLRHPGIVPIYDIREHDELIYYVMPFIEGDNLRVKLAQRSRMSPKETQRILSELCDSVAHSHRAGIVHRDIKPDNVILEGFLGKVLLMDFGIAKAMDDLDATGSGILIGTPTYMSPEQATGERSVDHRSDIYSLGVLGYHMLIGQPPFVGKSPHDVILKHLTHDFAPVRKANPSVPRILADAITRCLEKDPDERFQSVMDLWSELQKVTFFPQTAAAAPAQGRATTSPGTFLFGGLAAIAFALAAWGTAPLEGLTGPSYFILAALFAALAVLVSPALRDAGDLGQPLGTFARRSWRRLRRPSVEVAVDPGAGDNPEA